MSEEKIEYLVNNEEEIATVLEFLENNTNAGWLHPIRGSQRPTSYYSLEGLKWPMVLYLNRFTLTIGVTSAIEEKPYYTFEGFKSTALDFQYETQAIKRYEKLECQIDNVQQFNSILKELDSIPGVAWIDDRHRPLNSYYRTNVKFPLILGIFFPSFQLYKTPKAYGKKLLTRRNFVRTICSRYDETLHKESRGNPNIVDTSEQKNKKRSEKFYKEVASILNSMNSKLDKMVELLKKQERKK